MIGRTNDDDDEKEKIIITIKERCGLWGLQECDHWAGLTPSVGSLQCRLRCGEGEPKLCCTMYKQGKVPQCHTVV